MRNLTAWYSRGPGALAESAGTARGRFAAASKWTSVSLLVELHFIPALGEGGQGGGQTHPGEVARPELVLGPHQTAQTPAVPLREQSQSRHGDVDHGDFLRQQPEVSANLLSPGSWQEPAAEPPSSSGMTWS